MTKRSDRPPGCRLDRSLGSAGAWGFAEATLFFVVPDVLLTWVALEDPRRALRCCGAALAGALVGGCAMYLWGAADIRGASSAIERLPAISTAMLRDVRRQMVDDGLWSLFVGPLTGTPYKVYAVEAGAVRSPLWLFLLASIPARGVRFVALTVFAAAVAAAIGGRLALRGKRAIHLSVWAAFYIWYFTVTPN